jgi:hypothetical protein
LEEGGINALPYLDDFFFSKKGKHACMLLCRRIRKDFFDAGPIINESKSKLDPARQLGFDVDMGEGEFRVPVHRWETLHSKTEAILAARGGRVHAKKLSSLTGTVISMKLAWGYVTQLYTRHLYASINSVFFLS